MARLTVSVALALIGIILGVIGLFYARSYGFLLGLLAIAFGAAALIWASEDVRGVCYFAIGLGAIPLILDIILGLIAAT